MKPTFKSKELEELFEKLYGRTSSINSNKCINPPIGCGEPATEFRNEISLKEYQISGLCQNCQDKIFGAD